MTTLLVAALAAYGTHLAYTALVFDWRGLGPGPATPSCAVLTGPARRRARAWLVQAGLDDVRPLDFGGVITALFVGGAIAGGAVFGSVVPALVVGGFVAATPVAGYRRRRDTRRELARQAWPRLIDEVRILISSGGRSVPQALFEVGRAGPGELRPAFEAAHREWLLSTDFARTLQVLKDRLADPTADTTCETLLVAHELGGTDVDRRLDALAADRRADVQGRKDAHAKQAGVRFARRFVLVVPLGMALVGLSIGNGRAAYRTPMGQLVVVVALGLVALCWVWAGRIMRLPDEQRVFP